VEFLADAIRRLAGGQLDDLDAALRVLVANMQHAAAAAGEILLDE